MALSVIGIGAGCTKKPNAGDLPDLFPDRTHKFDKGVPQDPGEAGKKTLQGIDSDSDGIRDDIQRYIVAKYPNHIDKQKALRQAARAYFSQVGSSSGATEAEEESDVSRLRSTSAMFEDTLKSLRLSSMRSARCLITLFGTGALNERLMLQARILNTFKRSEAFLSTDHLLEGVYGLTSEQRLKPCE